MRDSQSTSIYDVGIMADRKQGDRRIARVSLARTSEKERERERNRFRDLLKAEIENRTCNFFLKVNTSRRVYSRQRYCRSLLVNNSSPSILLSPKTAFESFILMIIFQTFFFLRTVLSGPFPAFSLFLTDLKILSFSEHGCLWVALLRVTPDVAYEYKLEITFLDWVDPPSNQSAQFGRVSPVGR